MERLSRLLLSSLFLCVGSCSGSAYALSMNGFAYGTKFLNQDFREDKMYGAINLSHSTNSASVKAQLATTKYVSPVRRLHINIPINRNYGIKVGRTTLVRGLYDSVTGSPSDRNVSVLMQAPYNDNFLTASFSTLDGVTGFYKTTTEKGNLYFEASYGEVQIAKQEFAQEKTFNQYFDYINLTSTRDNYSLFSKFENMYVTLLVEKSYYSLKWEPNRNPENLTESLTIEFLTKDNPNGSVFRVGMKAWDVMGLDISTEHFQLESSLGSTHGYYVLFEKSYKDYVGYTGYTRAESQTSNASDAFIGIIKTMDKLFFILEYHDLSGFSWSQNNTRNSNSLAFTTGYKF